LGSMTGFSALALFASQFWPRRAAEPLCKACSLSLSRSGDAERRGSARGGHAPLRRPLS
jgi:hypothetical protein